MSKVFTAFAISPGLALGTLHLCRPGPQVRTAPLDSDPKRRVQAQLTKECDALAQLAQRPDLSESQRALLEADRLLLEDPELHDAIFEQIDGGMSADEACQRVFADYARQFEQLDDPHLAHRGRDIFCLGERLASRLSGMGHGLPEQLDEDTLLVVPDLTAAEFIRLPKTHLCGVVLERGNVDDHLAILLRSAGIPTLVMPDALTRLSTQSGLLDADKGQLTLATNGEDLALFRDTLAQWQQRREKHLACLADPAATAEGEPVWLGANIGSVEEAEKVGQHHLDGIGLLRSEFLYMAEGDWPNEARQYSLYRAIAQQLNGTPLVIRTFDFGADKALPGLNLIEANPALGQRAIRLGLAQPERLKTQLAAIVRLAMEYPVKLLLPMISLPEELDGVLTLLDEVKVELAMNPTLPVGIMVETPAAVLMLDAMAARLDFASVGTNDLAQYCYAADRNNASVSPHYPQLSPALIRLLHQLSRQAKALDLPLSLCGELASEPRALPLLLAMGLRSFSITPVRTAEIKYQLRQYRQNDGKALLAKALACTHKRDLLTLLNDCVSR
ncbi:phosphoenolpyruvate--protein phosphotransferase [Ferrimonas balearica]|uniref:phosphoenolpyruvate--protein phosphotransferase n=1 Tax=Ferrimonas balearica TaxID=44012 RepID=UPI001C99E6D7|nr:phosphoenolpyruvate--protein phosphotransferase [Ferrimonas balearica]MBY5922301.1 phosphoenolpyruvate--protein phosphotransferase [Ferrimonas balearica]MBY5994359.1 phosphoenolpyruvate--protein phosphotransferase [Ferrimonas balearica]